MKRILILLLVLCSLKTMAQYPVSSISITLPPQPKPNTGDWAMPFIITAQAKLVNGQVPGNLVESRILLTIKKDGAKFCSGFTSQNAPMSVFNAPTKTWSGGTAFALLGNNCFMPPGNYELCVQFFTSSIPVMPLSNETCKSFTIQDVNNNPVNYSPPQNLMPFDGKVFTQQEANLPMLFRWTPILPKPKDDVLYKIKIVEIMPGQSKAQAILNNVPLAEKELRSETQTSFKLAPRCHNCGLGWWVEALSAERVQGREPRNFGKSEATGFSFKTIEEQNPITQDRVLSLLQPANGTVIKAADVKKPVNFTFTVNPKPEPKDNIRYDLKVWEVPNGKTAAQVILNGGVPVIERRGPMMCCVGQVVSLPLNSEGKSFVWTIVEVKEGPVQGLEVKQGKLLFNEFSVEKTSKGKDTIPKSSMRTANVTFIVSVESINCQGKDKSGNTKYWLKLKLDNDPRNNPPPYYANESPDLYFDDNYNYNVQNNLNVKNAGQLIQVWVPGTGGQPGNPRPAFSIIPSLPFNYPVKILKNTEIFQEVILTIPAGATAPYKIKVFTGYEDDAQNPNIANTSCELPSLPPCPCDYCDDKTITLFEKGELTERDGILNYAASLTIPGVKIKQLKAELIGFSYEPENKNSQCLVCNKDDRSFGNITGGTLSLWPSMTMGALGFDGNGGNTRHTIGWWGGNAVSVNNANLNMNISLPPSTALSCCNMNVVFCMRITFMDEQCRSCSMVKCVPWVRKPSKKSEKNN